MGCDGREVRALGACMSITSPIVQCLWMLCALRARMLHCGEALAFACLRCHQHQTLFTVHTELGEACYPLNLSFAAELLHELSL